jgi:hypothetical protein
MEKAATSGKNSPVFSRDCGGNSVSLALTSKNLQELIMYAEFCN